MNETPEQRASSVEAVRFARREACREVWAEAVEECARVAEETPTWNARDGDTARFVARRIRALAERGRP